MRLKTPAFWYDDSFPANALACLLSPLSLLYRIGHFFNQRRGRPYQSRLPVICVGNIVAGGGGKTPAALALMTLILEKHGDALRTCFLTRGYGGRRRAPHLVDPDSDNAAAVGDEALLLARLAATIVAADRAAGAQLAERSGFDLIIMDDGLQNPGLCKTLRLIVIDGPSGFGNRHLLPAGPLRESLASGLQCADAFIFIGNDKMNVTPLLPARPLFHANLTVSPDWKAPTAISVVAFCGLARPEKFRASISTLGLNIAAWFPFPDHHIYTSHDLKRLNAAAALHGLPLLTTAKDAVKLPADFPWHQPLHVLPVELTLEDAEAVHVLLGPRDWKTDMKNLRYRLEAALLYILFFFFRHMPLDAASACGGWIGRTIGPRLGASRKARAHLRLAFPDTSDADADRIIRGMWDNLARVIAEYPHLKQIGRERTEVVGGEEIKKLVASHQPAILLAGHLANWEAFVAGAIEKTGLQMDVVYRAPNNPYVARLLDRIRSQGGDIVTIPKSRQSVRTMIESLKKGRYIGMLIDQKYNEGIAVPFFGHLAMSSPAYAQLAQKFGCPLIPGQIERLGGAHFRITAYPSLRLFDDSGAPRPAAEIVAEAHHHLEDWIRQHPEQWLWLHRRWSSAALANRDAVT